jgi:hypothetical protein
MKTITIIAFALALAGCATFDVQLDNRVTCTVAKDKAFVGLAVGPGGHRLAGRGR